MAILFPSSFVTTALESNMSVVLINSLAESWNKRSTYFHSLTCAFSSLKRESTEIYDSLNWIKDGLSNGARLSVTYPNVSNKASEFFVRSPDTNDFSADSISLLLSVGILFQLLDLSILQQ